LDGCHKKQKGSRPDYQTQEVSSWKKLRRAFKDEYARTRDLKSALEAMQLVECTLNPHDKEILFPQSNIAGMHREKLCAAGLCHDECYRLTKGKNAKKRHNKYLKKHGGKLPSGYTPSSPSVLAESSPQKLSVPSPLTPIRIQHKSRQSALNP